MSEEEAKLILDVKDLDAPKIIERYEMLMKLNGESPLYLQSKIVRARERLENQLSS